MINIYKLIRCSIDQKWPIKEIYRSVINYDYRIVRCPICGKYTLNSYHICENCGWEHEPMKNDYIESSANHMSIYEYRKRFREE